MPRARRRLSKVLASITAAMTTWYATVASCGKAANPSKMRISNAASAEPILPKTSPPGHRKRGRTRYFARTTCWPSASFNISPAGDVSVPEDIAVMGYDDIEFAESTAVPISTIRVSGEAFGAAAVELLFEEMQLLGGTDHGQLPEEPSRHILFQPELVIRQSTTNR
jgi:hypothetical protein